MKAALFIVLVALLIILPVEQVLAQASQQADVSVQQTGPSDGAAHLFRVPPLTEKSALLLRASSDRALLDTPFAEASLSNRDAVPAWSDWSDDKKLLVVAAVVLGLVLIL